ncbi:MAG: helix-turn-helix transcriptional regulator [Cyanobacteria bacterium SBLK]|nr:helix-turn-helix transcriptional regulator [Cyanobacteria bacterium SBLK]
MKPLYHPNTDQMTLSGVLYALGDPARLEIVRLLARAGEQSCNAFNCNLAKSTMSHHFKILREAGIIHSRKSGTQHLNSLRQEDLEQRFPGLLVAVLKNCDRERVESKELRVKPTSNPSRGGRPTTNNEQPN